jgi:hypothetical protein
VLLPGQSDPPLIEQDDNLKAHTDNWLACMRNRRTPNGSIETGFAHAVAVIMATRSYREVKKIYWAGRGKRLWTARRFRPRRAETVSRLKRAGDFRGGAFGYGDDFRRRSAHVEYLTANSFRRLR